MQYARPDAWLPTLGAFGGPGERQVVTALLTDQNEKGAILWIANKSLDYANFDGYFIYKHDTPLQQPPAPAFGDNARHLHGGRACLGVVQDHWKYSVEGAYQFGRKQDPDLNRGRSQPGPPGLRANNWLSRT